MVTFKNWFLKRQAMFVLLVVTIACKKEEVIPNLPENISLEFTKLTQPVWEGKWTAADPSIVRDGDTLRMYYSSLVFEPSEKLIIASAKSIDGISWTPSNNVSGEESIALDNTIGEWDNHLEAVSVIQNGSELWMYYCGYPEESDVAGTIVAQSQIGLAKSTDFISFTRNSNIPILELGIQNTKDANALFSPTVMEEDGTYYMFYMGYCIEDCSPGFLGVLGATSTDGENWTKLDSPILSGSDLNLSWAEVIKEPSIVKGPDGIFYMFLTGDKDLGVARSNSILGPYEVYPEPILSMDQEWESASVIAPSVIIENEKARMWYMGVATDGSAADFAIGYAEADFPFDW